MPEIQLTLSRLTIDDAMQLSANVITGMTGSAVFTAPNPTVPAFTALRTALQTANDDYEAGKQVLKDKLNTRDAAFEALKAGLKKWKNYCENTTDDPTKWEAIGFPTKSPPTPVGPLSQVSSLVVTAGDNDGTLDVAFDPVRGAASYEIQTSVDPVTPTSWQPKMTAGKSSATVNGFVSGTRQWIRVRAIGAGNSTGPWSDPAAKTVP